MTWGRLQGQFKPHPLKKPLFHPDSLSLGFQTQAAQCRFSEHFPSLGLQVPSLFVAGRSGAPHKCPSPVRLGLPSYLFVYLFIYLFIIIFNLLSSPRDGLASPAGLGGQGARQGDGQQRP